MPERNIFIDEEDLKLYVDVQPLYIDELENSKNSAAQSAQSAAESAQSARTWLDNIISYKSNFELFYAQAMNSLTVGLNDALTAITNAKNASLASIQTLLNNINNAAQQALTTIQTTAQQILHQIMDYAEEIEETVDGAVSEDYLIQSNAFESGDVSSIKNVHDKIISYARSTFDKSKFTIVGSTVITDNGIASGFSGGNYLEINNPITNGSKFIIISKFTAKTGVNYIVSGVGQSFIIGTGTNGTNTNFQLILSSNGTSWDIALPYGTKNLIENQEYYVKLTFDGSKYVLSYSTDGITYIDDIIVNNSSDIYNVAKIRIGNWNSYGVFTGSIDLKQFSITVDGVEVFSGNRTGIDTIKPYDYTLVGTPTISADGIASGFSTTNYLTITTPVLTSNNFSFKGTVDITNRVGTGNFPILYMGTENDRMSLAYQDSKFVLASGNSHFTFLQTSNYTQNGLYYYEVKVENNVVYLLISDDNGQTYTTLNTPLTSPFSGSYSLRLGNSGTDYFSIGSIDLNAFKIYVDGDLVSQPCLKIPYTESKTGSKIVDSIYRDRVNDMAEQFGYAPYYTLSDTDFTLPKGEIYGMMENLRKLIIERTTPAEE